MESLSPRERSTLFQGEAKASARYQYASDVFQQCPLVGERQHRFQEEHNLESPVGQRRDVHLLEVARQVAGQFSSDAQSAGGVVDARVTAARVRRDQPAGAGDPATQIEHRSAGADPSVAGQLPNLACPHEAFLTHILARTVGGFPGPPQRRQEWFTQVLSHRYRRLSRGTPGVAIGCDVG